MSIAFLNGDFVRLAEARISPLDRGFLFGDGIYEVIPSYAGKMVGFGPHIERMKNGLEEIGIDFDWDIEQWRDLCSELIEINGNGNLGIYLHVSRGADNKRFHAFPENVEPTVFAFTFAIAEPNPADRNAVKGYSLTSTEDLRWKRCHIKSTALLGNVLHFQHGYENGSNETLLYNANNELTEASASNIYIVKNGVVATPIADNQILSGITRLLVLDILRKDRSIKVEERTISMDEVRNADEIWISSSSKEIAPITELDGKPVGDGQVGEVWQKALSLYAENKFNY